MILTWCTGSWGILARGEGQLGECQFGEVPVGESASGGMCQLGDFNPIHFYLINATNEQRIVIL